MPTHICSPCGGKFATEQEYLNHTCGVTGVTPKDPANLGADFEEIQTAALKRGADKKAGAVDAIVKAPVAKAKKKK